MNYPDALYGFYMDFKKPTALITHFLAEYTSITNGSYNAKHPFSSNDDYFNNGIYQSGWTYFGNTIGSPYFTTKPIDENGITKGVIQGDNRFKAVNIGFKGNLNTWKYKSILSYITYVGWYDEEYNPKPTQFSGLFEVVVPKLSNFPFFITIGTAFDTGTYSPSKIGGFLKISKRGIF